MAGEQTVCPRCNAYGWHLAWCPDGPGPSPRLDAGLGTGRELNDWEKERQATSRPAAEVPKEVLGDGS